MNPLLVTWPPILYTDYGYQNFKNWIEIGGFDNITFKQNGKVMKLLTKLSIQNLLHPFQSFILGQKNIGPKLAAKYKIPLIRLHEGGGGSVAGTGGASKKSTTPNSDPVFSKNTGPLIFGPKRYVPPAINLSLIHI